MLVERMRNEITRLSAVKAFDMVATSELALPLAPVLGNVLTELTTFLRKANRPLRQAALSAIDVRPPAFDCAVQMNVLIHMLLAFLLAGFVSCIRMPCQQQTRHWRTLFWEIFNRNLPRELMVWVVQ